MESQRWEYRVIHINVNQENLNKSNPEAASRKLQGSLSPEYIKREFPKQYKQQQAQQAGKAKPPTHPAEQLQHFLNILGNDGWEMVEAAQVGPLMMFFFKRPLHQKEKSEATS